MEGVLLLITSKFREVGSVSGSSGSGHAMLEGSMESERIRYRASFFE